MESAYVVKILCKNARLVTIKKYVNVVNQIISSMTEDASLPVQILHFKIKEFAKDVKILIRSALNVIKMDVKSVKKDFILKKIFVKIAQS